jgi:pimeloyl-ACP methyl ester carboxylesterase
VNDPRITDTLVVLVHGAWHSSIHWAATQRLLAHHGIASIAVDLPGHGFSAPMPSGYLRADQAGLTTEKSALSDVTMHDAADVIIEALDGVRTRFGHVVLVGHSAGGGPVSLAAEQSPQLIDQLIYLAAFVPAGRPRFSDYITAEENASAVKIPLVADPAELGAHRINPLDPTAAEVLRRAFLNDLPPGAFDGWRHLLHPDEPYASLTAPVVVTPQRWGRVRRTYIRLIDDLALPLTTQDLMIKEADLITPDNIFETRSLPGGHSPFVTRPAELAELLASIAKRHIAH